MQKPEDIVTEQEQSACAKALADKQEQDRQDTALAQCTVELATLREKYAHMRADFDNMSRRIEKERSQWASAAQTDIFVALLEVIDHLDRAQDELAKQERPASLAAWFTGFELIGKSFAGLLKRFQIKEITTEGGFDPKLHEAIMQVQAPGSQAGEIVQVLQKGYMLKDQVLRPARVSVAQ